MVFRSVQAVERVLWVRERETQSICKTAMISLIYPNWLEAFYCLQSWFLLSVEGFLAPVVNLTLTYVKKGLGKTARTDTYSVTTAFH